MGRDLLLEIRKAIGFLSNAGPDLLENHKATRPSFDVGHEEHWSLRITNLVLLQNMFMKNCYYLLLLLLILKA